MAYFPFFMELSGREGLIVGGGAVALRKIRKLLPYGPQLTVAAAEFYPEVEEIPGLILCRQPFSPELLEGKFFVIAATDDPTVNHWISALCRQRHIPVNVVDDRAACSFLFPALVKQGALSIGISTGGASPSAAIYLKEQIQALLPDNFGDLLVWLDSLREEIKAAIPEERRRAAFFSQLFCACMQTGSPLSVAELQAMLSDFLKEAE